MSNQSIFSELTNLYSVSKTLRFELKPQGSTLDWMNKKGLLQMDETKKEAYKKLKVYFDLFHREFIDKSLAYPILNYDEYWSKYLERSKYTKKDKEYKDTTKEIEKIESIMRKTVVQMFSNEVQIIVTPLDSIKDEDKKKGISLIWNSGSALKILKEYYKDNIEVTKVKK